ncbi:protein kinase [Micromonospora sp. NPDC048947]|uniref:serine/threonine protein kinase n=1 Tax=Micromonospora sp. NPDC048947 TaxID=3154826 RepID=UPI0033EEE583
MTLPKPWRLNGNQAEGGQAHVYKVVRPDDPAEYALKRLKNPARANRFSREVRAMEVLFRAGIAVPPVMFSDLNADKPWFAMPWYENGSLDGLSSRDSALPIERSRALLVEIAEILALIHERGMAHRDIKPGNILINNDGRPLVADFGLCIALGDERWTDQYEAVGPRNYIAPENADGINNEVDQRPADCYAFAKLCWSVITGKHALSRENQLSADNRLSNVMRRSDLEPLDLLFEAMLNPDPRVRFTDWNRIVPVLRGDPGGAATAAMGIDAEKGSASTRRDRALSISRQLGASARIPEARANAEAATRNALRRERAGEELSTAFCGSLSDFLAEINLNLNGYAIFRARPFSKDLADMFDINEAFAYLDSPAMNRASPGSTYGALLSMRPEITDTPNELQLAVFVLEETSGNVRLYRVPMRTPAGGGRGIFHRHYQEIAHMSESYNLALSGTLESINQFALDSARAGEGMAQDFLEELTGDRFAEEVQR